MSMCALNSAAASQLQPIPHNAVRPGCHAGSAHLVRRVESGSLSPGPPFHIRRAEAGDRPALIEMLSRCTNETRLRRFHRPVRSFPEPYLTEALEGRAEHFALVAEVPGAVVALSSCRAATDDVAEVAVLVGDSHQRHRIGTCLLRMLVDHADRSGLRTLQATKLADEAWILRVLRSYGTCKALVRSGVFEVTLRREPDRVPEPGREET